MYFPTLSLSFETPKQWQRPQAVGVTVASVIVNQAADAISHLLTATAKVSISPFAVTIIGAALLRPISITLALQDKNYYRVAADILAIAVLFFSSPYGALLAILIDMSYETFHFLSVMNSKSVGPRPSSSTSSDSETSDSQPVIIESLRPAPASPGPSSNPPQIVSLNLSPSQVSPSKQKMNKKIACRTLGIPELQAGDLTLVEKKYNEKVASIMNAIAKNPPGSYKKTLEASLDDLKKAYNYLREGN